MKSLMQAVYEAVGQSNRGSWSHIQIYKYVQDYFCMFYPLYVQKRLYVQSRDELGCAVQQLRIGAFKKELNNSFVFFWSISHFNIQYIYLIVRSFLGTVGNCIEVVNCLVTLSLRRECRHSFLFKTYEWFSLRLLLIMMRMMIVFTGENWYWACEEV